MERLVGCPDIIRGLRKATEKGLYEKGFDVRLSSEDASARCWKS